jgi:coenzyme PQQ biosynthesis protein PqqD
MSPSPKAERKLDLSFVPKLAKKARLRFDRHSGGHMIVYPERGLALNESAAEIVKRCDGTRTLGQIASDLTRDARDGENVEHDVLELINELARKGLLES